MARIHPSDFKTGAANATDTTRTAVIAAAGAGAKIYLTGYIASNTSATAEDILVEDGTTTKVRFDIPPTSTVSHTFATPLRGTANTAWNFSAVTGATTIYVTYHGYIGE
jgi:hypothetical protein